MILFIGCEGLLAKSWCFIFWWWIWPVFPVLVFCTHLWYLKTTNLNFWGVQCRFLEVINFQHLSSCNAVANENFIISFVLTAFSSEPPFLVKLPCCILGKSVKDEEYCWWIFGASEYFFGVSKHVHTLVCMSFHLESSTNFARILCFFWRIFFWCCWCSYGAFWKCIFWESLK